jgi:hypothetical protein
VAPFYDISLSGAGFSGVRFASRGTHCLYDFLPVRQLGKLRPPKQLAKMSSAGPACLKSRSVGPEAHASRDQAPEGLRTPWLARPCILHRSSCGVYQGRQAGCCCCCCCKRFPSCPAGTTCGSGELELGVALQPAARRAGAHGQGGTPAGRHHRRHGAPGCRRGGVYGRCLKHAAALAWQELLAACSLVQRAGRPWKLSRDGVAMRRGMVFHRVRHTTTFFPRNCGTPPPLSGRACCRKMHCVGAVSPALNPNS